MQGKGCIYTALFGDYDTLLNPLPELADVDLICFTDTPQNVGGRWKVRELCEPESARDKSAEIRIKPHEYVDEYDWSVWIDSNIYILKDFLNLIDWSESLVITRKHPIRNCIIDEARVAVNRGRANKKMVDQEIDSYISKGFPRNNGLSDINILIRKHNNSEVIDLMDQWWHYYLIGSSRNMLSFEFVMWKNEYYIDRLDIKMDGTYFELMWHKPNGWLGWCHQRRLKALESKNNNKNVVLNLVIYYFLGLLFYIGTGNSDALVRYFLRKFSD